MESLNYVFTNLSMVFRFYVKLSKSQLSCSGCIEEMMDLLRHNDMIYIVMDGGNGASYPTMVFIKHI